MPTRRKYVRTAVVAFWLCMTGCLIRYEAFPEYFTHSLDGYRNLLSRDILVLDSWMKVMFREADIGYSHTRMEVNESDPVEHYIINNRVHLSLKVMGEQRNVHVLTSASLDMTYDLQKFSFSLSSRGHGIRVKGVRAEKQTFDVEVATGTSTERIKIDIPDDVVLYSPMTEIALKRLRPGRQINIRTLDPVSLKRANIVVRALRREPVVLAGEKHEATVLAMEYQGMKILTWIDSEGNMLRQETPLGLVMEKCTPDDAFAAVEGPGASDDILKAMALQFLSWDL